MPDDEFEWDPDSSWNGRDEAGLRCAEMVLKAMREPCKTAREGYLAAAQLFALAATTE